MTAPHADLTAICRKFATVYAEHIDADELWREMHLYAHQMGGVFKRWDARGEQHKIDEALTGMARIFCETARAKARGYEYDDLGFYSPGSLATLVPIALDESWDGLTGEGAEDEAPARCAAGEGGSLLAMVADIRRVLGRDGFRFGGFDIDSEAGMDNLVWLSGKLGGPRPVAPGYRRAAA